MHLIIVFLNMIIKSFVESIFMILMKSIFPNTEYCIWIPIFYIISVAFEMINPLI